MTKSIRISIESLAVHEVRCSNPGLFLDRFQPSSIRHSDSATATFLNDVSDLTLDPLYGDMYAEWQAILGEIPGCKTLPVRTDGRFIVGLGNDSVRETGVTLMPIFGVPVIPGSAIKGLVRRYCELQIAGGVEGHDFRPYKQPKRDEERRKNEESLHRFVFGDTTSASYFTFFDAWLVPSGGERLLHRETLTVHHPRYYNPRSTGRTAPWDLDDPTPVPFLSAAGTFLIAIQGPDTEGRWAELMLDVATAALEDWGVGAKTSSGFGRLRPVSEDGAQPGTAEVVELSPEAATLTAEVNELTQVTALVRIGKEPRIRQIHRRTLQLKSEPERLHVTDAIYRKAVELELRREPALANWFSKMEEFLRDKRRI